MNKNSAATRAPLVGANDECSSESRAEGADASATAAGRRSNCLPAVRLNRCYWT